jgi:hypothetical protein
MKNDHTFTLVAVAVIAGVVLAFANPSHTGTATNAAEATNADGVTEFRAETFTTTTAVPAP